MDLNRKLTIPIGVTAKNEAQALPYLIESITKSIEWAEQQGPWAYDLCIVLNGTTDHSEEVLAAYSGFKIMKTETGLVAAQRAFAANHAEAPFIIFSDADILLDIEAVFALTKAMIENPELPAAYAEKVPLRPHRKTFLAEALYRYNLHNGYQSVRHYLNGQFFAIRNWSIPETHELTWDTNLNNRFLSLEKGIRCDDIYISRDLLQRFGAAGLKCVATNIYYQPPETLVGMFRKYQRMKLEIERLHVFFPTTIATHQKWGQRKLLANELLRHTVVDTLFYLYFLFFLEICKLTYALHRFYYSKCASESYATWKPIEESKKFARMEP